MAQDTNPISDLIETLIASHPAIQVSDKTFETYLDYLSKINLVDLKPAIDFMIENNPRFPTISEIRKCAMDYKARRITEENNIKAAKQREEENKNRYVPTPEEWAQLRANLKKGVINVNDSQD